MAFVGMYPADRRQHDFAGEAEAPHCPGAVTGRKTLMINRQW